MTTKPSKFAIGTALAAALSMGATPAAAVDIPYVGSDDAQVQTGAAEEQNQHRRYRRHGYRHRNRVDAGDVIAGVLVLGTIAALASSSRNRDRDRYRERDRDYRERDYRERDYRNDRRERDNRRDYDSNGIANAADMCVDQIERGSDRVDDVSSARRTSDGWRVAGTLNGGEGWSCWIDNDGRIRSVDIGTPGYSYQGNGDTRAASPTGQQWDNNAYARARASTATAADSEYAYRDEQQSVPAADGPQPAYPGGPLPGEEGYAEAVQSGAVEGDGRYATADAPDFAQSGD